MEGQKDTQKIQWYYIHIVAEDINWRHGKRNSLISNKSFIFQLRGGGRCPSCIQPKSCPPRVCCVKAYALLLQLGRILWSKYHFLKREQCASQYIEHIISWGILSSTYLLPIQLYSSRVNFRHLLMYKSTRKSIHSMYKIS